MDARENILRVVPEVPMEARVPLLELATRQCSYRVGLQDDTLLRILA